ncbi:hypothetical protein [Coleofasciculus sp. F4-SAH-05]
MVNTVLVMGSSYAIASLADGVIRWLHPVSSGELLDFRLNLGVFKKL